MNKANICIPKNPDIYNGSDFTNINPQAGVSPLGIIKADKDNMVFSATVSDLFCKNQILTRGRPHFGGIHIALLNDAICSMVFEFVKHIKYGEKKRYVETSLKISFLREAFYKGGLKKLPSHSVFADDFQFFWQILDINGKSIERRGYLDVTVVAVTESNDLVPVLTSRCTYLGLKGVH